MDIPPFLIPAWLKPLLHLDLAALTQPDIDKVIGLAVKLVGLPEGVAADKVTGLIKEYGHKTVAEVMQSGVLEQLAETANAVVAGALENKQERVEVFATCQHCQSDFVGKFEDFYQNFDGSKQGMLCPNCGQFTSTQGE